MVGMNYMSFLILTVIGAVVAVFYHYGMRFEFLRGIDSLFAKFIIAWVGGWLGSPVLGHWMWKYESVYICPAILGAIALVHLHHEVWKGISNLSKRQSSEAKEIPDVKAA